MDLRLFTSDLSKLTYDEVKAFCAQRLPESTIFDYKLQPSSRELVTKAVSALANTQGGLVIFGVRTNKGSNLPMLPIEGMPANPGFTSQIENWCIRSVIPPIAPLVGYVLHPEDSSKAFGVVRVEASDLAHTVDGGKKLYVRHGDKSEPQEATLEERELLRNRRELARRIDAEHAEDLRSRVSFYMQSWPHWPFMLLRILPQFPLEDSIERTRLFASARSFEKYSYLGRVLANIRSYSNGVLGDHTDSPTSNQERNNWRFALTTRGELALADVIQPGAGNPRAPLHVGALLSWSRMAAEWSRELAEQSGFWGTYEIRFEAGGWQGIHLDNSEIQPVACSDNNISIPLKWSAIALRDDFRPFAAEMFGRLFWALGQGHRLWTYEHTVAALDRLPG